MMLGHFVFGAIRISRMSGVRGVDVREGRSEQTRFGEREVDVALPGGTQSRDRPLVLGSLVGHRVQSRDHCVGQLRLGVLGHRGQQSAAVGVVPVGGRVTDAGQALDTQELTANVLNGLYALVLEVPDGLIDGRHFETPLP